MWSKRSRCLYLALIVCLSTVACASWFRDYGRFVASNEVTSEVEGYMVNPDYRYYVSGPHLNPNALMGLDRRYHLDPDTLWREVDMSPPRLAEIVEGMRTKAGTLQMVLNGFILTDNHGQPIGIWYSILQARTFVKMNKDGTVRIDTPPLETYERASQESHRGEIVPPGPTIPRRY